MQADLGRLGKACCGSQTVYALEGAPLPVQVDAIRDILRRFALIALKAVDEQ
jgi:hypothetical protein